MSTASRRPREGLAGAHRPGLHRPLLVRHAGGKRLEGRLADHFREAGRQGAPDTGKVLVADKPRTLAFSWHIAWGEMAKEKDSRVTFTIEPDGDAVKLTLVHDEFDEGSKAYEALKGGWQGILAGLVKTVEAA